MNVAEPQSPARRLLYRAYVAAFFVYLAVPLFPTLPWRGFTLDWFFGTTEPKLGMFNDRRLMQSLRVSLYVGVIVAALSVIAGTLNAFLFERREFPFKRALYILMIVPLVIPGIILGISILVFASMIAEGAWDVLGADWQVFRPGLTLVILGQFSFLTTITTLVIAARLRRFDVSLEEAALNLGASRPRVLATITLPYLAPALIGAFLVAFLVSFENFNTTLMLVGSDSPLTITLYDRVAKVGSTPVLNATSVFLMLVSGGLALLMILVQRPREPKAAPLAPEPEPETGPAPAPARA
jgi:spermidine/putrescine transport system permease protein